MQNESLNRKKVAKTLLNISDFIT